MSDLRFSKLVDVSGRPRVATLWGDPLKDREFMRAVRENRILTVQSSGTTKRDFGTIGFHQTPHAAYFVFPKRLPKQQQDSRVVGIKYDLIDGAEIAGPTPRASQPGVDGTLPKNEIPPTRFTVTVRRTANSETTIEVEAATADQARQTALEAIHRQPFDPAEAVIHERVLSLTKNGTPRRF